jgi:Mn2+/Fe2+ NRAMP family transporter
MDNNDTPASEATELEAINQQPLGRRLGYYTRKSGPGWLQAAITLGGGSLASSLFLGVILEYKLMWLQPLAMILGVIMLSAIGYVTLTSGRRPFGAINEHVSPVLGWAWLIAAMMANIVWCLPQFALGTGAVQQNLVPSLEGSETGPWVIGAGLFILAALVVRAYDRDSNGVKLFEIILKILVGIVVVSFFLVVGKLTTTGALDWGAIFKGFIPDFSYLNHPAPLMKEAITATGEHGDTWTAYIAGTQKDKIIAAFGTAVGINMTFLLPYSMLKKGWGKAHRGLAIFDLSTALIIPFMLATGCIVIVAGSQFHGKSDDILNPDGTVIASKASGFNLVADTFVKRQFADQLNGLQGEAETEKLNELRNALPLADKKLAAMLVDRKDRDLGKALSALAGEGVGRIIFGIGVLGMAVSTIIILMLINGFCLCEALGRPNDRKIHFLGSLIPGLVGICFPLIWTGQSKAALAVPTSVIGMSLLPIAYFTFLLLMNSKNLLGDAMPTGVRRFRWNGLMLIATTVATFGSVWALKDKNLGSIPAGKIGIALLIILFILGWVGFLKKSSRAKAQARIIDED